MSKSIMIVICDFLLLSLLSLADFESAPQDEALVKAQQESVQQQVFADTQMLDLLKMSLDSERDRRMSLDSDVSKLSKAAEENRLLAESQKKILDARERELKELTKTKSDLEKERESILKKSRDLEARIGLSESRNIKLQEEIVAASSRLEKSAQERAELERKLGDMRQIDSSTKQKLEAVQEELRQNKENLSRLQRESEQQQAIFELAQQNARNVLTALTGPIVEQADPEYTVVVA